MKKGILILYDRETDYAIKFMNYFNEISDFIFEIRVFTNLQMLDEYLSTHEPDVLLVSSDILIEDWQYRKVKKVIWLTEDKDEENNGEQAIYKYQSMDNIKEQLIKLGGITDLQRTKRHDRRQIEYVAVCSPFGGSGKTLFSLSYGQASAKRKKTLYIGMEAIKSFSKSEKGGGSFSELLYFLKEKATGFNATLQKLVSSFGELDCICSPDYYGDLYEMEEQDVDYLLEQLEAQTQYEVIIFDLGVWNFMSMYLISKMDKIYIPEWRDSSVFPKEKYLQENWNLNDSKNPNTVKQMVTLPYDREISQGDFKIERMLKTKMGQWVWNILENESIKEKGY